MRIEWFRSMEEFFAHSFRVFLGIEISRVFPSYFPHLTVCFYTPESVNLMQEWVFQALNTHRSRILLLHFLGNWVIPTKTMRKKLETKGTFLMASKDWKRITVLTKAVGTKDYSFVNWMMTYFSRDSLACWMLPLSPFGEELENSHEIAIRLM